MNNPLILNCITVTRRQEILKSGRLPDGIEVLKIVIMLFRNSFNIDINEAVNFLQPSSSAIALARILDQSPSQILGGISANGRLVLSNPNGLIFAPSATGNVGSLIASGLDITAGDFMAGNLRFDASGTGGTVINHGLLQAATGGSSSARKRTSRSMLGEAAALTQACWIAAPSWPQVCRGSM